MLTDFTPEQLKDPAMAHSKELLTACLQCDYCLDICPTYQVLDDKSDSPRDRVRMIKEMFEAGTTPKTETVTHISRCLSCLACMSTCPSRWSYMDLVDHAREYIEDHYKRPFFERALRWSLAKILPYPGRLRLAMKGAKLAKPISFVLPDKIRRLVDYAPDQLPPPSTNDQPQVFPAIGKRTRRVALLNGCAQQAVNTDINDATIRILRRHGCEVVIAQGSGCCGALTYHMGKARESRVKALSNIRAWNKEIDEQGLDAIVINSSGCGTVVKDYGHMFRNLDMAAEAEKVSTITKDISELLLELTLNYQLKPALRVAYHASCSLQFGQRIRFAPKKLLKAAGFTVVEPKNQHTCCGSAGTYNLLQPKISQQLKLRKVETLEKTSPDVIAAGNIGCMMQIGSGTHLPIVHTVELLDWVTGGPMPEAIKQQLEASNTLQEKTA